MRENLKYLVVGDTIIDETVELKASGLSLESPTLKTTPVDRYYDYGGAANVAKYLSKFGRDVTFATSMDISMAEMFEERYNVRVLNYFQGKPNVKTRYWVSHGDSRYKYLQVNDVNGEFSLSTLEDFDIDGYDIVAFSDYRCGFIKESFISHVTNNAKITYASSQISSQQSNYDRYFDIDYLVCNKHESQFTDRLTNICITMGAEGCVMNGVKHSITPVKDPINTIGAGDCFYAALLATGDPNFANKKASEYVSNNIERD